MYTKAALAGLMVLSLASATPTESKRGKSLKLPLFRRNANTDDQSLSSIYTSTDWTTEVSFGGQKFVLQVDTGSSDIWVLSTEMNETEQAIFPSNHFFDPSTSSSFKMVDGASFNIAYGDGAIYSLGKVGTDYVGIGSDFVNMPFGLATECSPTQMVDTMYDGILGLAFGAGNTIKPKSGPTWMEAIQSQLASPVFTFNLPLTSSGQMIEFGHIDHTLYNGTLMTAAINNGTKNDFHGWATTIGFSAGGKNISTEMNHLVMDTGGLQTTTPDSQAVKAYWSLVSGAKDVNGDGTGWVFPCQGPALPDLTFDFLSTSGHTVSGTVRGKFMNSTSTVDQDTSMCIGAFQSTTNTGVIGYGFFHSFFTVFDQSVPSISFAPYPDTELDGKVLATSSSAASSSAASTGTARASGSAANNTSTHPSATGATTGSAGAAATGAAATGAAAASAGYHGAGAAVASGTGSTGAGSTIASGAAAASSSGSASGGSPVHTGSSNGPIVPSMIIAFMAAAAAFALL